VDFAELEGVLERVQPLIAATDHRLLTATVDTLHQVTVVLEDKTTKIGRLRQMIFARNLKKKEPRRVEAGLGIHY